MKQAKFLAIVAASLFYASFPLAGQDAPQGTAAPAGEQQHHMPLPKPTNLKVLPKDISPDDLIKTMRGYSQALGVHCNFCHEVDEKTHKANFAADTKEDKKFARTMIAMTREINTKFMTQINDPDAKPADKTVTCGTCHRGSQMPAQFVPKPEEHGPAPGAMPMQKPQ
ncbi:c-type cytochrome [Acidobacterium sp. S8]|uniref:c-type cytochrome n=1 Tax=Acidobacterium sp. S8 TaxID=1641854 RepID=UPI00131C7E14|nr:c-type cytochrome [Acidobacterium sp. S8]